jgi:hypothetical protein
MPRIQIIIPLLVASLSLLAPETGSIASAGVIIDIVQSGPDVIATGSGTLDVTAFGTPGTTNSQALMEPAGSWMIEGPKPPNSPRTYTSV